MIKYDLHSHTNFSDGRLTERELIERAISKEVDVLAITDHDTVDGISPARDFITINDLPIKLIPGVEISTKWESFEIHIVGLNIDDTSSDLLYLLHEQQKKRAQRAQEIGIRLAKRGYEGVFEDAKKRALKAQITRAHFAQVLVERGVAKNVQSVFKKYLGRNKIGYVPSNWCDMATAINAIKLAGGISVLAHPARYQLSNKWMRRLLNEFKCAGGQAMEVAQPQQSPSERQFLGQLSQELDLYASQGSDFHFPMPWSDLGKNLYLPKNCREVWQNWEATEDI